MDARVNRASSWPPYRSIFIPLALQGFRERNKRCPSRAACFTVFFLTARGRCHRHDEACCLVSPVGKLSYRFAVYAHVRARERERETEGACVRVCARACVCMCFFPAAPRPSVTTTARSRATAPPLSFETCHKERAHRFLAVARSGRRGRALLLSRCTALSMRTTHRPRELAVFFLTRYL